MSERMTAWQCIGCGRIDGEAPCIGVCQDRKVHLVYAQELDAALNENARLREDMRGLAEIVRFVAHTTPREGQWEDVYRALQARARAALAELERRR